MEKHVAVYHYGLHGIKLVGSLLWGGAEVLGTVVSRQCLPSKEWSKTWLQGRNIYK